MSTPSTSPHQLVDDTNHPSVPSSPNTSMNEVSFVEPSLEEESGQSNQNDVENEDPSMDQLATNRVNEVREPESELNEETSSRRVTRGHTYPEGYYKGLHEGSIGKI